MGFASTKTIYLSAGLMIAVLGTCFIFGFPMITIAAIREWAIKIRNDTMSYDNWVSLRRPGEISAYVFNITNPDQVMRGAKPILQEVGPFMYIYRQQRVNVVFSGKNRLSSNVIQYMFFSKLRSAGDDEEVQIITPNVPLMMMIQDAENSASKLSSIISNVYGKYPWNGLFLRKTVKEAVFGGYTDPLLYEVKKDDSTYHGVFFAQNGTKSHRLTIFTGRNDFDEIAYIDKMDNIDNLYFYSGNHCANFSRAIGAPEFVANINDDEEDDKIRFFEKIGRFMDFKLVDDDYDYEDYDYTINCKKYVAYENNFYNKYDNPLNDCYESRSPAPPGFPSYSPEFRGLPSGVFDAWPAKKVHILFSYPHFLHGDEFLLQSVDGLSPRKELHESIHVAVPELSVSMLSVRQYQANVQLTPNAVQLSPFSAAPKIIYPIAWWRLETRASRKVVKNVYLIVDASWIIGFSVGPVIFLAGLVIMFIGLGKDDYDDSFREPPRTFVSASTIKEEAMTSSF